MKRFQKNVLKYLLELLIVGFGVFLGFYVSELQNKKKIEVKKEKSINFILEELENNKNNLTKAVEYHRLIKSSLDSITKSLSYNDSLSIYFNNKKFSHNKIKGWAGFGQAELDNTAFENAKISNLITEYDIELLYIISKYYKRQETYSELGKSILDEMISMNSSTKVVDVINLIELMTTDLLGFEEHLVVEIENVQNKLKTQHYIK